MNEKDARAGRTVMGDELDTINRYEALAHTTSPETKDVIDDIIEEEKEHVGEAAKIIDAADPTAKKQMLAGVKEASVHIQESAKQMRFSPYNGTMTEKEPQVKSVEEYDNSRKASLTSEQRKKNTDTAKDIDRKNLTDKAYEDKWHETKSGKTLKSFREVFGERREGVIAKANGRHIEKKVSEKERPRFTDEETGEEVEIEQALPGSEEQGQEFIDDRPDLGGHIRGLGTKANPKRKKEADKVKNKTPAEPKTPEPQGPIDYSTRPQVNDFGQTPRQVAHIEHRMDDRLRDAKAASTPGQKRLLAILSRLPPEKRTELVAKLKSPRKLTTFGNDPTKKSTMDGQTSASHIAKARNPSARARLEQQKMNNKKASPRLSYNLGIRHDPFKGYFNTQDPAFRRRFTPEYAQMHPSGTLYVTRDPTEFSMEEYNRYNTMGGRGRRLPTGKFLAPEEDYRSLGGTPGSTQQITPMRVQEKDMFGKPVFYETRTPKLTDEAVMLDDGSVAFLPQFDAEGRMVYEVKRRPKYRTIGNTILTQKGKDMSALQRYTGRLDTKWDRKTKQWVPIGLRLDEKGQIPDEVFEGIYDENGNVDPDLAMDNLRRLGYRGNDNRWAPDTSKEVEKFYKKLAYQKLVEDGTINIDNPSHTEEVGRVIDDLAKKLREEDIQRGIDRDAEAKERRKRFFDADQRLQDEASDAANEILDEWIEQNGGDYEFDDETDEIVLANGKRVPMERIEAWVDANTQALIEEYRTENVRQTTDKEKADIEWGRRVVPLDRMTTEYYLQGEVNRIRKEEGREPTPDEIEELGDKVRMLVEKVPYEKKKALVEHIRDKDWARVRETMRDMPLYMHPDDIYHQSRAHEEDLARMKADAEATGGRAQQDLYYVNTLRGINADTDKAIQGDPRLKNLRLAIEDLKTGRIQLVRTANGMDLEYRGNDPHRGDLGIQTIKAILDENNVSIDDYDGRFESDTRRDFIEDLKDYGKYLGKEYAYDTARQKGFTPKGFDYLKNMAGMAESRQNKGGNTLSSIKDQDIRDQIGYLLDMQGASAFGGDLDNDIRMSYADKKRKEDMPSVIEAVLPEALSKIRDNYAKRMYHKQFGYDNPNLKHMETVMGMPEDEQIELLNRILGGRLYSNDPHFSNDFLRMLQRHTQSMVDRHSREGLIDELVKEYGPKIKDYLAQSNALDAAQVTANTAEEDTSVKEQETAPKTEEKPKGNVRQRLDDRKAGKPTPPRTDPATRDRGASIRDPQPATEETEDTSEEVIGATSDKKDTEHEEKSIPSFRDVFGTERNKVLRKHHGI